MSDDLSLAEIKKRLRAFAKVFRDASNEQQMASIFWTKFYECYGIKPESATIYEQRVSKLDGAVGRIDSFIPGKLIVEHKSKGADLDKAYEQAQEYFLAVREVERPQYIITSDFARIHLHDLRAKKTYKTSLEDLPKHAAWFRFLIEDQAREIEEEKPINRNAAYAISKLHEGLLRINFKGRALEVFLNRILFCLFADDTGIFGEAQQFRWLVEKTREDGTDLGARLTDLFGVLDKPVAERQTTLDNELAAFAYVNGDLFRERAEIPAFNSSLREQLLTCIEMDWSEISPAIFGAMFQGVLEEHSPDERRQATRRESGAHYTSERNILRVINPLFMDDLRAEFEAARRSKPRLKILYDKLPTLTFFDPACGCGNFLVIAYRDIRRLENEVIAELFGFAKGRGLLDVSTLCRVRVSQFYGIEIDDAAAHIARVAMWITDHQMNEEAAKRFGTTRPTIPLVDSAHIVRGNALRMNWNELLLSERSSYVFGNPPFVGKQYQSDEQKADLNAVAGWVKKCGVLDYVSGWYFKAAEYIQGRDTEVAFVSTSSVTQGEQVSVLWRGLAKYSLHINFAHRTFKWMNEGKGVAAVHCVIVGFSRSSRSKKVLYSYPAGIDQEPVRTAVQQINPYLVDANWVVIENRSSPLCNVPSMAFGSMPNDGGFLLLSAEAKAELVGRCPNANVWIKRFVGSEEFINGIERWCLWLVGISPQQLRSMPEVYKRVEAVRDKRLKSKRKTTQELAEKPFVFGEIRQPATEYLAYPEVSSERRHYVPIGFVPPDVIASNKIYTLAGATRYQFGVLSSAIHMAWMRAVCGRLKSDYQFSAGIVYNNFPWAQSPAESKVTAVEEAAAEVLAVRNRHVGAKLADLYDPVAMPSDLLKAHQHLDRAVDAAYSYRGQDDDVGRVRMLFELYQRLTTMFVDTAKKPRKRKAARQGR